MNKKIKIDKDNIKESFQSKKFKNGSYSTILGVVAIIIVVIINSIVAQLPNKYTEFDMSAEKLSEIGSTTEEILANVDQDVTIYLVAQESNIDATLEDMLERYDDESSYVTLEEVDPALEPTFTSNYDASDLSENSVIVESGDVYRVIDNSDIYVSTTDYTTYTTTTSYDGEAQVTSAVDYVTGDDFPVVYQLTGHNETELSTTFTDAMELQNLTVDSLNLITSGSVPEDCSALIINAPQSDITSDEADAIKDYIEAGGSLLIARGYSTTDFSNLEDVLAEYNVETNSGLTVETDSSQYIQQYPYYLVPTINSHDSTTEAVSDGVYVIIPAAMSISTIDSTSEDVSVTDILTTSASAYFKEKIGDDGSIAQEDSDEVGSFNVGVASTITLDDGESNLVYISSDLLFDDDVNSGSANANLTLVLNNLSWLVGDEDSIQISSKSTDTETLVLTDAQVSFWKVITLFIIPVGLLGAGLVIWLRRRRM